MPIVPAPRVSARTPFWPLRAPTPTTVTFPPWLDAEIAQAPPACTGPARMFTVSTPPAAASTPEPAAWIAPVARMSMAPSAVVASMPLAPTGPAKEPTVPAAWTVAVPPAAAAWARIPSPADENTPVPAAVSMSIAPVIECDQMPTSEPETWAPPVRLTRVEPASARVSTAGPAVLVMLAEAAMLTWPAPKT